MDTANSILPIHRKSYNPSIYPSIHPSIHPSVPFSQLSLQRPDIGGVKWTNKRKSLHIYMYIYIYIFQAIPKPTPFTTPPLLPLSLILLPSINPLNPLFCNPTTQLTPPPQISSPPCVVVPFAVLI